MVSPLGSLATGTAVGAGIIIALYPATNKELTGSRLLLAIFLGAAGVFLLVEGVNRIRARDEWKPACLAGSGLAIISLVIALLPASNGVAASSGGGLRLSLTPVEPEFFTVAFEEKIGQPAAEEGWRELRQRGGIDVGHSRFRLILANEGPEPVSILSVHPEVIDSRPALSGTLAWHPAQGEEAVGKMTALIDSAQPGSEGRAFKGSVNPERPDLSTPYFDSTYILLRPGEVYPLNLTVVAKPQRSITYRVIAEGASAGRRFVTESPAETIMGGDSDPFQTRFARYYRDGFFPNECTPTPDNPWVNARYTARSKACPDGLGVSYPVQPPSAAVYPPGEFELSLGLTPGRQSVEVSGVPVGRPPAASPVGIVVLRLLKALGTWDRCSVRSPEDGYWIASWERWRLDMTFDLTGAGGCTAASLSAVRRIRTSEPGLSVETDRGRIVLGAPVSSLPVGVLEVLDGVEGEAGPTLYVAGTEACPNPGKGDLAGPGEPVSIAVLAEDLSATSITGLDTYLPASDC